MVAAPRRAGRIASRLSWARGSERRRHATMAFPRPRSTARAARRAAMPHRVRVNLANPSELLELPGIGPEQARAIVAFRAEHGPITDARQLASILRAWPIADAMWSRVEFDPADSTAPEAPGA